MSFVGKALIIIIIIIIIIILYFYRVIQSAINIAAIKRSPVNFAILQKISCL